MVSGLVLNLSPADIAGLFAFGYVCGSIPFGLLITRIAGLGDIRAIGSGNIGATNVLRTGKKGLAAATLLLDALKGTIAVVVAAAFFGPAAGLLAGLAAFVGHLFPVWLGFRGGKGVATYIGVLFGIDWRLGLLFAVTWLAIAFATRFSSLAALVATVLVPLASLWIGSTLQTAILAAMAVLIFIKHAANIRRLMDGSEPKIGAGAPKTADEP